MLEQFKKEILKVRHSFCKRDDEFQSFNLLMLNKLMLNLFKFIKYYICVCNIVVMHT